MQRNDKVVHKLYLNLLRCMLTLASVHESCMNVQRCYSSNLCCAAYNTLESIRRVVVPSRSSPGSAENIIFTV